MLFMPFNIIGIWFRGLLSIAILTGGIYFLSRWYADSHATLVIEEPVVASPALRSPRRCSTSWNRGHGTHAGAIFRFVPGWNRPTIELAVALALLAWATAGRAMGNCFQMMFLRPGEGAVTDRTAWKVRRFAGEGQSEERRCKPRLKGT